MVAPAQELTGIVPQQTVTAYEDLVLSHYGQAGADMGYSSAEVLDAFPLSRQENSCAVLDVEGMQFGSWRQQVGVFLADDRSRGGLELSPDVTAGKVMSKAVIMHEKQLGAAEEHQIRAGNVDNVGGKGGICATAEEIANLSPQGRQELFRQHAEAHGINPYTNVTATDIGTFPADMNAIAAAIAPTYGLHAGGAASGVTEEFGGMPKLHGPRTGLGGALVLDHYLRERARQGDQRVIDAINGGEPLTVLIQGLGKAGMPFLENLPYYVQPKGALEQHGAILAKNGHLDREQLADLARRTKLAEPAASEVDNGLWLPPSARSDFWASGADILIPAFDRNQFTAEDALAFGGMAIGCLANDPVNHDALPILADKRIDVISDSAFNVGGTVSSQGMWEKIVHPGTWSEAGFETTWHRKVLSVARNVMQHTALLRAETGTFVSIPEATKRLTVDRAIRRMRAVA